MVSGKPSLLYTAGIDATMKPAWPADQGDAGDFLQELPAQALDMHALWQQIIW